MNKENDIKELYGVIRRFDNKKWLKMATTADLAKEIVNEWCCPSEIIDKYNRGIISVLKKIKHGMDYYDETIGGQDLLDIIADLGSLVKIKMENDEN